MSYGERAALAERLVLSDTTAYDPGVATDDAGLDRLAALPPEQAAAELLACCASPVWVAAMLAARPFADRADLLARADAALRELTWAQLRVAVDAHPRIGERVVGGHEAAWSAREQAGALAGSADVRARLVDANVAYERRFGHVFLIFASGRADTELLAAAHARLANDDETERGVVRGELARIVALRLTRLVEERLADR
jgi:2-oxo-4-hydroxy-4-carboxy-5-ureidoimidazoline decarboxylase